MRVNIYIRHQNEEAWKNIENKSAWVNDKLDDVGKPMTRMIGKAIARSKNGSCRIHGSPLDNRGRCLQKGCKYS